MNRRQVLAGAIAAICAPALPRLSSLSPANYEWAELAHDGTNVGLALEGTTSWTWWRGMPIIWDQDPPDVAKLKAAWQELLCDTRDLPSYVKIYDPREEYAHG